MSKDIDDVPESPWVLLYLARQGETCHCDDVDLTSDEGLGIEETMEQDAPRSHSHLEENLQVNLLPMIRE